MPNFNIEKNLNQIVIGIDEVGRGALAGPVVAAAVSFRQEPDIFGIKDSKKLSAIQRQRLFAQIIHQSENAVGVAGVEEINQYNILNATHLAMQRALSQMDLCNKSIIIDGNSNPFCNANINNRVLCITKGDSISITIAAASIIAKVARDEMMNILHQSNPIYEWSKNKGYGTKTHIEVIRRIGPSIYHRKLFLQKILAHI